MSPAVEAAAWGNQGIALMLVVLMLLMSLGAFHYYLADSLGPHKLRLFTRVTVALVLLCLALSWAGASRMFF